MKHIFEFVLATIIIYFVWNILKRIFFKNFTAICLTRTETKTKGAGHQKLRQYEEKINWDAETVDYEEVKENNNKR
jgi:hypothetical protein